MSLGESSRLSYDTTEYESQVQESTKPMTYFLDSFRFRNHSVCSVDPSYAYPQNYTHHSDAQIEIENTLSSRDVKKDRSQVGARQDTFRDKVIRYQDTLKLNECAAGQNVVKNSLLTNPKSDYRALSTQHLVFTYLPYVSTDVTPLYGNPGFASSRDIAIEQYKKAMKNKQ